MNRFAMMGLSGFLLVSAVCAAPPALTIYNQDFAVVRQTVPLDLKPGLNSVRFEGTTAYVEPSTVILRDPTERGQFAIREQNYRSDPVSQDSLLKLNEGKTIQFEVVSKEGGQLRRELVSGKIIRSGPTAAHFSEYGQNGGAVPIIEIDGKLRFTVPGHPIFPGLAEGTILKPTLSWQIEAAEAAQFDAELSYLSGGMSWLADYNLVLPVKGDTLDFVGWVTIENLSGSSFQDARIKLMAGDVKKVRSVGGFRRGEPRYYWGGGGGFGGGGVPPAVTEKTFDEYHLYTLERPTSLLDSELKQVEFVRAAGVQSQPIFIYDGVKLEPEQLRQDHEFNATFGNEFNKKVRVLREFTNSVANRLGLPLPKGTIRFYRRNTDGQMEFTGENLIDHTPRDEAVRLEIGNAFDVVGERRQTDFKINLTPPEQPDGYMTLTDPNTGETRTVRVPGKPAKPAEPPPDIGPAPCAEEAFEITLRNHKDETIEVRIIGHLYRGANWTLKQQSHAHSKLDARTIEFRARLKPDATEKVTYTVHYSWTY